MTGGTTDRGRLESRPTPEELTSRLAVLEAERDTLRDAAQRMVERFHYLDGSAFAARDELEAALSGGRPATPEATCDYCGSLDWTKKQYGRVTHKHGCPAREDTFCQSHPDGCPPATPDADA